MKFDAIIVDADICIKICNSEKYRYLEKLFPIIADKGTIFLVSWNFRVRQSDFRCQCLTSGQVR